MKRSLVLLLAITLSAAVALLPGGCRSSGTSEAAVREAAVQPAPGSAQASPSEPAPGSASPSTSTRTSAASTRCGECVSSRIYPSGGVVRLDMQMPREVTAGAAFDHTLKVTNLTDTIVTDVVVTERLPKNYKFQRSDPSAKADETKLVWTLDSMDPKAVQLITVSGVATSADCLTHCATVTFQVPACASAEIIEPKLALTKTAPREVTLCDPFPVKFVVSNNGTGSVQGVKVQDTLPAGLTTADGRREVLFDAGTLAAGQSKEQTIQLKASKTGEYVNKAVATSASGMKAEAATTTTVRQPVLAITKSGPEKQYAGRPLTYKITVTNKGDSAAVNTVVEDTIPQGIPAVQASAGGTVSGSKVVWQLGTLAPNASRELTVSYTASQIGTLSNTATARAVCADQVTASATTAIQGIAAVLLEVVDTMDPVEIGSQTTYIITATNQGSIPSTDIEIVATLEEAQEFVSADGATSPTVQGRTIKFAPLGSLAARQKAAWRVVVKAAKPGDVRFTVAMNTAELGRPVDETEATQQYQ